MMMRTDGGWDGIDSTGWCAGVGKTTAIRELARLLADECHRRVVICDTSNEIGGDGDIPHHGVGTARRMQVLNPLTLSDTPAFQELPAIVIEPFLGCSTKDQLKVTVRLMSLINAGCEDGRAASCDD